MVNKCQSTGNWKNQLIWGDGKRGNTGQARAFALAPSKKEFLFPDGKGLKE